MKKFTSMLILFLAIGAFLPLKSANKRMQLFEAFTSTSSAGSASIYPSWDALMRVHEDCLIPIKFNTSNNADSLYLANPTANGARVSYYKIDSIPYYCFNGKKITSDKWNDPFSNIDALRAETSPISFEIGQVNNQNNVTANIKVTSTEAINGKILKVALVEFQVNFEGQNGVSEHSWVVRDFASYSTPINLAAGGSADATVQLNPKTTLNKSKMYLVAFLQDETTKEVLQAGHNLVNRSLQAQLQITGLRNELIKRNNTFTKTFTVTNKSNVKSDIAISVDENSFILDKNVCKTSLSKSSVSLDPGASEVITLTVESSEQAYFARINVNASPISTDKIIRNSIINYDVLTEDAQYAVYGGYSSSATYAYQSFNTLSEYKSDLVMIPATIPGIFRTFDPTIFKVAVLGFDFFNFRTLALTRSAEIIEAIEAMLDADKRVFITSEYATTLAFANDPDQPVSPALKFFLIEKLGLNGSTAKPRFTANSQAQITSLLPFSVTGNIGDIIGANLGTMNATQNQNNFNLVSDAMTLSSESPAKKIAYFDGKQADIAGIRAELPKGKIVYLTYGLDAFANATDRTKVLTNSLNWLLNDISEYPKISLSEDYVKFGDVQIGETETKTITITNKGQENLEISKISLDNEDGIFLLDAPESKVTLGTDESLNITLSFKPNAKKDFYNALTISSNSKYDSELTLMFEGSGVTEFALPVISLSTDSLVFDSVEVLKIKNMKFKIHNTGTSQLRIENMTFTNNTPIVYEVVLGGETPYIIEPQDSEEITVSFQPVSAENFNAILFINSTDKVTPTDSVILTGKGYIKDPGSVDEQGKSKNGNFTMRTLPNPMVNNGNVEFTVANTPANVELYVIDATGKAIETIYTGASVLGNVNLPINTAKYSNGYYTIIANVNGEQISLPLIISK